MLVTRPPSITQLRRTVDVDGGHANHSQSGGERSSRVRFLRLRERQKVDGVAAAFPVVSLQGKYDTGGISFGPPPFISGTRPGYDRYSRFQLRYAHGRPIDHSRGGEVVLGADFARELNALRFELKPSAVYVKYVFTPSSSLNSCSEPSG